MYPLTIIQHLDCVFIYNISCSTQDWLWAILENNPGSLSYKGTVLNSTECSGPTEKSAPAHVSYWASTVVLNTCKIAS